MKQNKLVVAIIIVIAVVAIIVGIKFIKTMGDSSISMNAARSKGNPDAKVKIIEFIDFQCPACAFGAQYLSKLYENYPKDMYIQLKHFPLRMHRHAITASIYADCAAKQGKFWDMHDKIIDNQTRWSKMTIAHPYFMGYAQNIGLDTKVLESCLEDPKIREGIEADRFEGQRRNLRSTPTYFINDEMVVGPKSLLEKLAEFFPEAKEELEKLAKPQEPHAPHTADAPHEPQETK